MDHPVDHSKPACNVEIILYIVLSLEHVSVWSVDDTWRGWYVDDDLELVTINQ